MLLLRHLHNCIVLLYCMIKCGCSITISLCLCLLSCNFYTGIQMGFVSLEMEVATGMEVLCVCL
jgi:hypothetical protein